MEPTKLSAKMVQLREVIYGRPGTGKSTLLLTHPRCVVIDTNHGLEGGAIETASEDALVFEPKGHKDLTEIYFWCKAHLDEFDTIGFDSIDTLVRMLLEEVTDKGATPEGNYNIDMVPAIKDYLAVQKQVERILADFRRLGKHMVVTAGSRAEVNKEGQVVGKWKPSLSPGVLEVVNDWSNIIGEIVVLNLDKDGKADPNGDEHRVLFTNPASLSRECRTRWRGLLPHVIDPTFQRIWDLMHQGGE